MNVNKICGLSANECALLFCILGTPKEGELFNLRSDSKTKDDDYGHRYLYPTVDSALKFVLHGIEPVYESVQTKEPVKEQVSTKEESVSSDTLGIQVELFA